MALAKDPLSVRKPENLPSMDIIKDSINPRAGPGISGLPHSQSKDWTPGFVKSTTSRTGANTKQGSRDRYVNFSLFLYTISHKAKTTKNRPYK